MSVSAQAPVRGRAPMVDVWSLALDLPASTLAALRHTLAEDELGRVARFRFARDADRFTAGRGLLRQVLGRVVAVDPATLRFAYGPHGKPALLGEPSLRFNLSHSGGLGLLAVVEGAEIGVDVELDGDRDDLEDVARSFFAQQEVDALMSVAPGERHAAFLRCWTRKEAYVKALGGGLQIPLQAFAVSLAACEPARLRWCERPGEAERWTMLDLSHSCAPAIAAACVEGQVARVRLHLQETS